MTGVERTATRIAGFASAEMDFQLMRMLGVIGSGGGAAGEIFAARARIEGDDPYAWPPAFAARAIALDELAEAAAAKGHAISAGHHLLRAASYHRSAEYFSDPFASAAREHGLASRASFIRAMELLGKPCEMVDIPYGDGDLPGYFLRPPQGARDGRTLIALTGFDGTGEELYFHTAAEGLARGFNILIAEGPGQVGCLRRHPQMLFRPDYERPIAAIIDHALTRPEVAGERLALYGISFGGYFALRGGAHDRRIRALIANSPIVDLYAYMAGFTGKGQAEGEEDLTLDMVDAVPDAYMPRPVKLSFKSACRRFGVTSYGAWLAALKAYRVVDDLPQITCPLLAMVGTGEGAEARRQHDACCAGVSGPVTQRVFEVEEGADMHCQLGNLPLSNAVVYDWLEEMFGG